MNTQTTNGHESDYKPDAWKEFDSTDLETWVCLLIKRAGLRANPEKAKKDLQDAKNYFQFYKQAIAEDVGDMETELQEITKQLGFDYTTL